MYEILSLSLISIGLFFPILKIPIFFFFLYRRKFQPDEYIFLEPNSIGSVVLKNYTSIHLAMTFILSFLLGSSPKMYFYSLYDLFYNFLIYNIVLTNIFGKNLFSLILVSMIQASDTTPFLMALLDNYVLLYCNRINYLVQKIRLWGVNSLVFLLVK